MYDVSYVFVYYKAGFNDGSKSNTRVSRKMGSSMNKAFSFSKSLAYIYGNLSNVAIFWGKKRNEKPYSTCFKPFFLPMAALPKT